MRSSADLPLWGSYELHSVLTLATSFFSYALAIPYEDFVLLVKLPINFITIPAS